MEKKQNLAGPQIKKLRLRQNLSRAKLASRCRAFGWKVSSQTLARIEARSRRLADFELFCISKALDISLNRLLQFKGTLPKINKR